MGTRKYWQKEKERKKVLAQLNCCGSQGLCLLWTPVSGCAMWKWLDFILFNICSTFNRLRYNFWSLTEEFFKLDFKETASFLLETSKSSSTKETGLLHSPHPWLPGKGPQPSQIVLNIPTSASSSQPFWHRGLVSWKTIFPWTRG